MATDDITLRKAVRKAVKKDKTKKKRLDNFDRTKFAKQVRDKPFWIEDELEHQQQMVATSDKCCFWHIIGLPEKEHLVGKTEDLREIIETKKHPIYDYEMEVYNTIMENRYVRIKKATGIGITTFILGLMIYLCVKDDKYRDAEMGIVTGPRLDLASYVQSRLVRLLADTDYRPKQVGDDVWINGCRITAYPSQTFDTARGLDKCRFFFVDEADFFHRTDIEAVMTVLERYEAKSHPTVVLASTTNEPVGLFAMMDSGKYPQYKTIEIFYERGLGKIFTPYEIEQAKKADSFEREYNGRYGQSEGNIFPYRLVDDCIEEYDLNPSRNGGTIRMVAVDPAFGSSKFAIIIAEKIDGVIYIKGAEEYNRPSYSEMVDYLIHLSRTWRMVAVDDTSPGLIKELVDYNVEIRRVSFRRDLSRMTTTAASYVAHRRVRIHPKFTQLISQLKSVRFNDMGHPDKSVLSFDLGDAFLMAIEKIESSDWVWVRF